ncbi:hypothetical protein [Pseudobdellovibrio sp. HCB154]|uniref:hypothetical protein n=1 Tax=Pseudobdellovibrio sp. HCB154 TaxID=3386277 RepID=UPI003916EFBF
MGASQRKIRQAPRKEIVPLTLDAFSSMESLEKIAKYGEIIEASASGILINFKREDFIKKELRSNLNLDALVGHKVFFTIHEMDLEISGTVARTKFLGKKGFQVAVDYSTDAPEYWRECLIDLLPNS